MNKTVCDICFTNEANKFFKVKRLKTMFDWERIDICVNCYNQLINNSRKGGKEKNG